MGSQDGLGNTYQYGSDGLMIGSNGGIYTYDALGQRVRKDTSASSTEYIYFGGQLLAMRDPSSGTWKDRIYGPSGVLATVDGSQIAIPSYPLGDHLGSVTNTTDGSGNITGTTSALPYGQLTINNGADNFPFTDHERDENGSDATLFRQYSSSQGRWLSPDPYNGSYNLADPQSLNRYAYLINRPMASVDRSGLDGDDDDDGGDSSSFFPFPSWSGPGNEPEWGSIPGVVYVDAWMSYIPPASDTTAVGVADFAGNRSAVDGLADFPYLQGMFHGAGQPYWGGANSMVKGLTVGAVGGPALALAAPLAASAYGATTAFAAYYAPQAVVVAAAAAAAEPELEEDIPAVFKSAAQLGEEGEAAVRAAYSIGDKIPINVNGVARIPDGLTRGVLSEVKNVGRLSYTQQLRDYNVFAQDNYLRFDLYVRPNTVLSGPLQTLRGSGFGGTINIIDIPF